MTLNFLVRFVSSIPLMSRLFRYVNTIQMYFLVYVLLNGLLHSLDTLVKDNFDFDKSSQSILEDGMHNKFDSLLNI